MFANFFGGEDESCSCGCSFCAVRVCVQACIKGFGVTLTFYSLINDFMMLETSSQKIVFVFILDSV